MKIMAALDLSDYAHFVLIKAIKTARQQNAKLDIMIVAEEHDHKIDSPNWDRINETLVRASTQAAQAHRQTALAHGVKAKVRVRSGTSAAEEIINYQKSEKLDLIVLGRRSRKSQSSFPMGAVAQRVVAYATCTVMVVRCMEESEIGII